MERGARACDALAGLWRAGRGISEPSQQEAFAPAAPGKFFLLLRPTPRASVALSQSMGQGGEAADLLACEPLLVEFDLWQIEQNGFRR